MQADRTGFEQFHHINYHINRTGRGDNTNRDFLAGARCTLSVSWQAFLFSVSLPHPGTFDHFFLSSYRCDTILDSVYRCTVHVRMHKTETERAPWRPVSTGNYISVIAPKLSSLFWLLLAWIAGVASFSTINEMLLLPAKAFCWYLIFLSGSSYCSLSVHQYTHSFKPLSTSEDLEVNKQ